MAAEAPPSGPPSASDSDGVAVLDSDCEKARCMPAGGGSTLRTTTRETPSVGRQTGMAVSPALEHVHRPTVAHYTCMRELCGSDLLAVQVGCRTCIEGTDDGEGCGSMIVER